MPVGTKVSEKLMNNLLRRAIMWLLSESETANSKQRTSVAIDNRRTVSTTIYTGKLTHDAMFISYIVWNWSSLVCYFLTACAHPWTWKTQEEQWQITSEFCGGIGRLCSSYWHIWHHMSM